MTSYPRTIGLSAWLAAAILAAPALAQQAFPTRPVRVIVPFPAGGTSDILARLTGGHMSARLGQQIVVDNRPGASGAIGAELAAKAQPDGHTVILADIGSLLISQLLSARPPFDMVRDFAGVSTLTYSPHLFCVHPSVPARSVKDLVTLAKRTPGKLNYASSPASAPYLAGVLFEQRAGIKWEYITGRGGAQSALDVVAGQSDALFLGMLQTYPHVQSGRLRLLAVSSEKRLPNLPDTPTVAESFPGFVTGSWQSLMAPANTPAEVVARLHGEITRALTLPDVKEKLASQGTHALASSSADATRFIREERDRFAKLIKDANIQAAK